jgi:hypothetical protein
MYDAFGVLRSENDFVWINGVNTAAIQYWVTPQLWLKGGLGFANLQTDDAYVTRDLGNGGAVLGAIGFEILSAPNFALDLQGRIIAGTYNSGNDHLTSGTIGLGINWY